MTPIEAGLARNQQQVIDLLSQHKAIQVIMPMGWEKECI